MISLNFLGEKLGFSFWYNHGETQSTLNIEIQIVRFIQQSRLEELDPFFQMLTSSTTVVSIVLSAIFIWLIQKDKDDIKNRFYSFSIVSILTLSSLFSFGLKLLLSRPRPYNISPEIVQLTSVNTFSFPSGHTTAVCAIFFGLIFFYPKKRFLIPVFIWAVLVMYSRVAFGLHFISDIIAGALLSLIVALSLYLLIKANSEKSSVESSSRD